MFIELTVFGGGEKMWRNTDSFKGFSRSKDNRYTTIEYRSDNYAESVIETPTEINEKILVEKAIDEAAKKDYVNILNQYQLKKEAS